MDLQVKAAIEHLQKNGIRVAVDPSGLYADVYMLTLPNGDEYECLAPGLLKLVGVQPTEDQIKMVGTKK